MKEMGFHEKWRGWINTCLRSTSVLILVKGSPIKEFKMTIGLRQGDPLSPFLFLIEAGGFNIIMHSDEDG